MRTIIFCTFSDIYKANSGESINDLNVLRAISKDRNVFICSPKYKNKKSNLRDIINFFISYCKYLLLGNKIFIIRGTRLAFFPVLLRKLLNHKVLLFLGCTPLVFVERQAFLTNPNYKSENSFLIKFLIFKILPIFEKYVIRNASSCIVENHIAKKILLFYGARSDNIDIIPYYVNQYFLYGKNPGFVKNNKQTFRIGYTGRFKKYDLIIPILKALKELKKKYKIKLFLIGDGPTKSMIKSVVKTENLINEVKFLGLKTHKEVSNLLDEFHCLILPMVKNICPSTVAIKILEGVMKEKIIITNNAGYNRKLFLNYKDLIIESPNPTEIATKIELVIKNYNEYLKNAKIIKNIHLSERTRNLFREKLNKML